MCGIVGYIGEKECIPILMHGLQTLEYRGYDSAGIAVAYSDRIEVAKAKGKLLRLEPELKDLPQEATVGIGHTRWATHGKPSRINAHPHTIPAFAVVHNGIIENYLELKQDAISRGFQFASETDTEVILAHIDHLWSKHKDMDKVIQSLFRDLQGAFAIGILNRENPSEIYIAKQGSPAVLGFGENGNYFASDAYALLKQTQQVMYLRDGQYARVSKDSVEVKDQDGNLIAPEISVLELSQASLDKQGFKHFMLKEIHEQPAAFSKTLEVVLNKEGSDTFFDKSALGIQGLVKQEFNKVFLVGCGSAFYVGDTMRYFLEKQFGASVHTELASEFRYRDPQIGKGDLFIAISQSGETLDTLTSLKYAKEKGAYIHAVCNVPESSITRDSDSVSYLNAGPEIGVASTKAFTSQLLVLGLIGLAYAEAQGSLDGLADSAEQLRRLPQLATSSLNHIDKIKELAHDYHHYRSFLFIGRGPLAAIANEGALKLKEISYIHAEAYAGGELKHGPIALIDKNMPTMALVGDGFYREKMLANIAEVTARDGKVLAVGFADKRLIEVATDVLPCVRSTSPFVQAIVHTLPLQLFAYYVALKRGTDVDQPRNLAKSVTVE